MSPFRNILRLSAGDFLAKVLYFAAFVFLARVLGVRNYGVLEFAVAVTTYFLLLADGGLELWATRETARGEDVRSIVSRIVPLRLLMALVAFSVLLGALRLFPRIEGLQPLLILFGLSLFVQAASLKWIFMGRERMNRVAIGLVLGQSVFAVAAFLFIRSPNQVLWIPVLRLAGDLASSIFFWRLYVGSKPGKVSFTLRGSARILRPALTIGMGQGLGLVSYNIDSVLLGFLAGVSAVGWYSAAYKPVTMALALPLVYFAGLFPALARVYKESPEAFRQLVIRSLRLASIFALPLGIGGTFLAGPIIETLFGPGYENSVVPLRLLSWSGTLVILRGTFKQALNSAGKQGVDLRCAAIATAANVGLNLLLIPMLGILGAALSTVVSEILWVCLVAISFARHVSPVRPVALLASPMIAGLAMAANLYFLPPIDWLLRALIAVLAYFATLWLLRDAEVRSWTHLFSLRRP